MPNNCPQIHEQYKNLLSLKKEFDDLFDSSKLNEAYEIKKKLKLSLENLEELLGPSFSVEVNYSRPLKEMIEAGGYDWSNDSINDEHFPPGNSPETKKLNFELFEISKNTSSEDIEQQMEDQGLRPATLQELLAFGEKYPDKQRKFSIVALGSSWIDADGNRNVPYIDVGGSECSLSLDMYGSGWFPGCRFLAARK